MLYDEGTKKVLDSTRLSTSISVTSSSFERIESAKMVNWMINRGKKRLPIGKRETKSRREATIIDRRTRLSISLEVREEVYIFFSRELGVGEGV